MYRNSAEYDRLDKMVIEIYVDYGIKSFPLDEKELCKNMGIEMIPYSSFETEDQKLLKKRSLYGFWTLLPESYTPVIFYNDDVAELHSPATIKQTIRHEIKHVLDLDMKEHLEDDDLAEHFGRYLAAPIPYLVAKKITNINVIISTFGVSATMAGYISSAVINRIKKHGYKIFDYEKPLLELFGLDTTCNG